LTDCKAPVDRKSESKIATDDPSLAQQVGCKFFRPSITLGIDTDAGIPQKSWSQERGSLNHDLAVKDVAIVVLAVKKLKVHDHSNANQRFDTSTPMPTDIRSRRGAIDLLATRQSFCHRPKIAH
jgi:hypothetical protein